MTFRASSEKGKTDRNWKSYWNHFTSQLQRKPRNKKYINVYASFFEANL